MYSLFQIPKFHDNECIFNFWIRNHPHISNYLFIEYFYVFKYDIYTQSHNYELSPKYFQYILLKSFPNPNLILNITLSVHSYKKIFTCAYNKHHYSLFLSFFLSFFFQINLSFSIVLINYVAFHNWTVR